MAVIARVNLSVFLQHVGESIGNSGRFSFSNSLATNPALVLTVPSGFPLWEQTQRTDIHVWLLSGPTS